MDWYDYIAIAEDPGVLVVVSRKSEAIDEDN